MTRITNTRAKRGSVHVCCLQSYTMQPVFNSISDDPLPVTLGIGHHIYLYGMIIIFSFREVTTFTKQSGSGPELVPSTDVTPAKNITQPSRVLLLKRQKTLEIARGPSMLILYRI